MKLSKIIGAITSATFCLGYAYMLGTALPGKNWVQLVAGFLTLTPFVLICKTYIMRVIGGINAANKKRL